MPVGTHGMPRGRREPQRSGEEAYRAAVHPPLGRRRLWVVLLVVAALVLLSAYGLGVPY